MLNNSHFKQLLALIHVKNSQFHFFGFKKACAACARTRYLNDLKQHDITVLSIK